MKQHDEAAGGSPSSGGQDRGDAPFDFGILEEAVRSLEAIGGLMEKMGQIVSRGSASDAAMLEELKKTASPGSEQKILEAVLELAEVLRTGEIPAGATAGDTQAENHVKSAGRFRDLI